jgi:hypothetical protein
MASMRFANGLGDANSPAVYIHCHILPGIDDGPAWFQTSAEMCRLAAADPMIDIVTTPHSNHRYWHDRGARYGELEKLRERTGNSAGSFSRLSRRQPCPMSRPVDCRSHEMVARKDLRR